MRMKTARPSIATLPNPNREAQPTNREKLKTLTKPQKKIHPEHSTVNQYTEARRVTSSSEAARDARPLADFGKNSTKAAWTRATHVITTAVLLKNTT